MPSQLVIAIDSLSQEKARLYAGIILALAGVEDGDSPELTISEVDPNVVFGHTVSEAGPHIIIPASAPPPPPLPPPQPVISQPSPPASGTAGIIVDSDGIPWDGRIHAASKAKNADGSWRIKRNAEKPFIDLVKAELKRAMLAPAQGPQLVPAPPPPPVQQQAPSAPRPPAGPDLRAEFIGLVNRASAAVGAGKVSQEQINKCMTALGVDNLPSLGHRLDLVPAAANLIDGIIAGVSA